MEFLNRERELDRLQQALVREGVQLLVVYGRRRCGKSTLLRKLRRQQDLYFLATQGDAALQRQLLAEVIGLAKPGFELGSYASWAALFGALVARKGERFAVILDEFPYLAEADPTLVSTLQHLLEDRDALPFDLILCGSSQQMMERAVLLASAPLYGRADEILHLQPLEPEYLAEAFPQCSPEELVIEYAIWGGVPRYWQLRERYGSLEIAVQELALSPLGLLRDEPRRLLLDDISDLATPLTLLSLVASGTHRVSEIGARLGKTSADLTRPLLRLVHLGYVTREVPFGESSRKSKRTLYRVADPFMRFYHRFVVPNSSRIELGLTAQVWADVQVSLPQFVSESWEWLCRRAIAKGLLGAQVQSCQRWWGNTIDGQTAALDGVARSIDGTTLFLLEAKWSEDVNVNTQRDRLRVLGPQLPFYLGEEIVVVLAAKQAQQVPDGAVFLSPREVLSIRS